MPLFAREPVFVRRLREHFGTDPSLLPIVAETFETYEHANVHLALESYVSQDGRSAQILGISGLDRFSEGALADLVAPTGTGWLGRVALKEGPVQYVSLSLDAERMLSCVQSGLFLVSGRDSPLAVMIQGPAETRPYSKAKVEVMARQKSEGESFLADIRLAIRKSSIYRGRTLTLSQDVYGAMQIKFHGMPAIGRENIILPQGLLERIERQTVRFGEHAARLQSAGRHLRRGILLHGPPGAGKTLTAMYLASALKSRTVILLTGMMVGLLQRCCALARWLQPSIVILEDVDLIAEDRTRLLGGAAPLLVELLNEMDGLADDADIIFLLTTNRPEVLEPALAARPGRIDQAFEIPLPDSHGRRRLFQLYSQGMTVRLNELDQFVKRSKGASGAFIRELMRKAALYAADEGPHIVVEDRHVEEAFGELLIHGKELTKSLLGFRTAGAPE